MESIKNCWCWDDSDCRFPPHRRLFLMLSFILYLTDVGLDIWVALEYHIADKQETDVYARHYLTATLVFIIVPSLILNLVSWFLYTWGWLVYRSSKVKTFCRQRLKQLNYVEASTASNGPVPIQGVLVMTWPKADEEVVRQRSSRQTQPRREHATTSFIRTENPSKQSGDATKVNHQRRESIVPILPYFDTEINGDGSSQEGESEIDSGLEFYPLDLMDTYEYIAVTILHLFLLGYFFRVLRLLYVSSRTPRDNYSFDRYRDISFLRLVESFLESAPQLVLQLYLLVVHKEAVLWYKIVTPISIIFSVTSLALSAADYISACKDVNHYDPPPLHKKRKRLSWPAYIGVIIWHFCMIVSRALAIALFATEFGAYVFLIVGLHYAAMVYWMFWQQADIFKHEEEDLDDIKQCFGNFNEFSWKSLVFPCKQICDNFGIEFIVAGFNIFFHFKIRDGGTKITLIPFYTLTFIENALMILLWYFFRDYKNPTWYALPAIVTVFVTFFLGVVLMMLYYKFGQPSNKGHLAPVGPLDHPVMTATLNRMYCEKVERGNFFKRMASQLKKCTCCRS